MLEILNPLRVLKRDLKISFQSLQFYSFIYYWVMKLFPFKAIISLKIKGKGVDVLIRKNNKIDIDVIYYVFIQKFHLPPIELPESPVIIDLGSNIGLTILDYYFIYKNATIYGFELDQSNYDLAKLNCDKIENIHLFNTAVWVHNQGVYYNTSANSDAYSIDSGSETKTDLNYTRSITVSKIIESNNIDLVHYLKMDIEGAEKQILFDPNLDWLDRVLSLNIEMHNFSDKEVSQLLRILESKKFIAWKDTYHWNSIMAYKKPT